MNCYGNDEFRNTVQNEPHFHGLRRLSIEIRAAAIDSLPDIDQTKSLTANNPSLLTTSVSVARSHAGSSSEAHLNEQTNLYATASTALTSPV
jgi:hypothetical protein